MEEEKKAIERAKKILKEWQEIVDIEDTVEREIETTLYAEDMPFNELKILVNLVEQLEKENKELKKITQMYDAFGNDYIRNDVKMIIADREYFDSGIFKESFIPKSVIRDKIEETKQEDYFKKYYFDYQVNLYDFEIGYKKCLKEILGEE